MIKKKKKEKKSKNFFSLKSNKHLLKKTAKSQERKLESKCHQQMIFVVFSNLNNSISLLKQQSLSPRKKAKAVIISFPKSLSTAVQANLEVFAFTPFLWSRTQASTLVILLDKLPMIQLL